MLLHIIIAGVLGLVFLCDFGIQRTAAAPGIFHLLPEYLEFFNWIAK
jgi:hypothetical protein